MRFKDLSVGAVFEFPEPRTAHGPWFKVSPSAYVSRAMISQQTDFCRIYKLYSAKLAVCRVGSASVETVDATIDGKPTVDVVAELAKFTAKPRLAFGYAFESSHRHPKNPETVTTSQTDIESAKFVGFAVVDGCQCYAFKKPGARRYWFQTAR